MKKDNQTKRQNNTGICMCLGLVIGTAVGIVLNHFVLYMSVGLAIGLAIGSFTDATSCKKDTTCKNTNDDQTR